MRSQTIAGHVDTTTQDNKPWMTHETCNLQGKVKRGHPMGRELRCNPATALKAPITRRMLI